MIIPNIWEIKSVPNHQPDYIIIMKFPIECAPCIGEFPIKPSISIGCVMSPEGISTNSPSKFQ